MLTILLIITVAITFASFVFFQNASAVQPYTEIYSAFGGYNDLPNGGIATARYGDDKVNLYFSYGGADDNDHIIELRCSIDGSSYLKSNCTSEEDERRGQFVFPDGVMRLSYFKNGETSFDLPIPPVALSKTHSFGVKTLNDEGQESPAAIYTFKIRGTNPNSPGYGAPETTTSHPQGHADVTVEFNAIKIHNEHEGFLAWKR